MVEAKILISHVFCPNYDCEWHEITIYFLKLDQNGNQGHGLIL